MRRAEQAEQRKRRQIDLARLDAVYLSQTFDLGGENAVCIDGTLGDAGAAAGEQDRRHFIGPCGRHR